MSSINVNKQVNNFKRQKRLIEKVKEGKNKVKKNER